MKIRLNNGRLSYTGAYKLFVVSWFCGWCAFMLPFLAILLLVALAGGSVEMNGEQVSGFGNVLVTLVPMLFLFPIIIGLQGLMFGGMLCLGLWVFRLWGKDQIVGLEDTAAQNFQ